MNQEIFNTSRSGLSSGVERAVLVDYLVDTQAAV
jgi:hypothetical protein